MVRARTVLALTASSLLIGSSVGAAYYAHYYKNRELKRMRDGVKRDIERLKHKMEEREKDQGQKPK